MLFSIVLEKCIKKTDLYLWNVDIYLYKYNAKSVDVLSCKPTLRIIVYSYNHTLSESYILMWLDAFIKV